MGTSNSYGGPGGGTPLVPSWLDGNIDSSNDHYDDNQNDQGDEENTGTGSPDQDTDSLPDNDDGGRYKNARLNFTRFATSGGSDRKALGRAVSKYVSKAAGGPKRASRKMGSSRSTTVRLYDFLSSARTQGVRAALEERNLGHLFGRSIEDIFVGLADFICPDGGNIDEGIARNAYIETIADLSEQGITDLDALTPDQLQTIIEIYATHAIEARLCNDIGTKICLSPSNPAQVEIVQRQLHEFIYRGVSDAINTHKEGLGKLSPDATASFIDRIYVEAFTILKIMGETESDT